MAKLHLPPGIRYECIQCGRCCRSLEVLLTDAEHERLTAHDWSGRVPDYSPERFFARPQRTGACRFLSDAGLCEVHATLGLAAKPFAGRLFPFTFLSTPVGAFVGVRFNCPAVIRGVGPAVETRRGDLQRLFNEYESVYSPPRAPERVRFLGRHALAWPDVLRVEDQLVAFLHERDLDVPRRLLACRRLVRRLAGDAVRRGEEGEVGADPEAILAALRRGVGRVRGLSFIERGMVRLLVATFLGAALPSFRELSRWGRLGVRFGNVARRFRLALGRGRVRLPDVDAAVPVRQVGRVGPSRLDAASAAMLERYLATKIATQGFFGLSFFGRSFAEGLDFLASATGAIAWLAAAHAVAAGRPQATAADVEYGIFHVDFGYNYLGAFGGTLDRVRTLVFWHWATPERLLAALSADAEAER